MLSEAQAKSIFSKALPDEKIQDVVRYKDIFLFRVEHPDPEEKDFDPFLSVNVNTGEIRDFNIMLDGNMSEIAKLFANK